MLSDVSFSYLGVTRHLPERTGGKDTGQRGGLNGGKEWCLDTVYQYLLGGAYVLYYLDARVKFGSADINVDKQIYHDRVYLFGAHVLHYSKARFCFVSGHAFAPISICFSLLACLRRLYSGKRDWNNNNIAWDCVLCRTLNLWSENYRREQVVGMQQDVNTPTYGIPPRKYR